MQLRHKLHTHSEEKTSYIWPVLFTIVKQNSFQIVNRVKPRTEKEICCEESSLITRMQRSLPTVLFYVVNGNLVLVYELDSHVLLLLSSGKWWPGLCSVCTTDESQMKGESMAVTVVCKMKIIIAVRLLIYDAQRPLTLLFLLSSREP